MERRHTWHRRGSDRGRSVLEYAAVIALVAAAATGVMLAAPGLGGTITEGVSRTICTAFGGDDCGSGAPQELADDGEGGGGTAESPMELEDLAVDEPGNGAAGSTEVREECPDWAFPEEASSTRPDGSSRDDHVIGTFNMYGNVGNDDGDGMEIVEAIARSVEDREPTFLALQEVCETQWQALLNTLSPDYGVYFVSTPKHSGGNVTCGNGDRFGNAVVYQKGFADDLTLRMHDLESPEGGNDGRRRTPCVSSESKNVVFCSAHLQADLKDYDEDDTRRVRAAEAENLSRILNEEYDGYTTLLGGDLNAEPGDDALDNFYDPRYGDGAHGDLKEVDSAGESSDCRGGEKTTGNDMWFGLCAGCRKIDYIFVSNDVEIHDADATYSDHSDHDPLWSGVTF